MKKSASFRRSVRHSVFALGLLGLVAGLLGIGSTASAAPVSCEVDNSATLATSSSLQAAIDAASAGDTLDVKGTCVGTLTVSKNLTIKGVSPTSILDGNGAGSTLTVNASVSVTVKLKDPGKVGGSDAGLCPGGRRCSCDVETEEVLR